VTRLKENGEPLHPPVNGVPPAFVEIDRRRARARELRPSASEAVAILMAAECRCGAWKPKGHAFCKSCFRALPLICQGGLYNKIGHGFEEIFGEALEWLERSR